MPDIADYELVVMLAGGCSLNSSPGKNWVENEGGLPNYICRIARAVMRSGKSKSSAIAIAVSRVKKWAAGGDDVDADTRAKAAKAVAAWEKMKAKAKADNYVKASTPSGGDYLMLTATSYNIDMVRTAWDGIERERRRAYGKENVGYSEVAAAEDNYPYRWIKEMWSDHLIVTEEGKDGGALVKVPYAVNPLTNTVTFGSETEVRQVYVEVDEELSEGEKRLLADYV